MPPNDFTPNNAFEVYMKVTLDNLTDRINRLPCDETSKRLGKCENEISSIKGKATIIGAVTGFVSALFVKYIFGK